MLGRKEV
jgi:hypothetical protein